MADDVKTRITVEIEPKVDKPASKQAGREMGKIVGGEAELTLRKAISDTAKSVEQEFKGMKEKLQANWRSLQDIMYGKMSHDQKQSMYEKLFVDPLRDAQKELAELNREMKLTGSRGMADIAKANAQYIKQRKGLYEDSARASRKSMYEQMFRDIEKAEMQSGLRERLQANWRATQAEMYGSMTHDQRQSMYEQLFGGELSTWEKIKATIQSIVSSLKALTKTGLKGLGIDFKNLGESLKEAGKRAEGFFNAIKRIAIYRAIRWALKEITQAFQEGRQNAYQWAVLVGNQFAKSMDMLATSALYAKNSIGAMTMPLTNYLAPIIDALTDKFVSLVNVINQFIAVLTGATSWTMALKYPAEYLEQAAGSAKELKNQLLGFDELNVLNAPSGGGGASGKDFSSMFQDMKIDAEIKKRFAKIQGVIAGFSLALGALILPAKPLLGISLLALGATALASSISVGWEAVGEEIKAKFSWITAIVSSALLALGVLALPASPKLGIAMIVAGATGLVSTVAVNWSNIIGFLKTGFESIKAVGKTFLELCVNKVVLTIGNIISKLETAWNAIKNGLSNLLNFAISLAVAFVNGFTAPIQTAIRVICNLLDELFGKHYNLDVHVDHPHSTTGEYYNYGNQGNAITGSGNSHEHGAVDGALFANGGFPRHGSMFIAGESGAEFVGQIGGRTGVYNADQMAVALADANEGVIDALVSVGNAIVTAINNKDTSLNVNDVRKALKSSQLRYGV